MKKLVRLALLSSVIAIGLAAGSPPANAYFYHHHKHASKQAAHKHKRKTHVHKAVVKPNPMVREAQECLINLGYYDGKADGLSGPKTAAAIKSFQRSQNMTVTGKLTKDVFDAIKEADRNRAVASQPLPANLGPLPQKDAMPAQMGLVGPTDQQFADPLLGGPTVAGVKGVPPYSRTQELSSRYAKLDVAESVINNLRYYQLAVNGQPVLQVNNQPSIIGISPSYTLKDEDAVVLTSYQLDDQVCHYRHFLMSLKQGNYQLLPIGNCTQGYQARVADGMLFVTFPEKDDDRSAGAVWRYDNGDLEKM